MEKKLKAKWVKALRSGRYQQTKGFLHDEKGYCCLGVLCRLMGAEKKELMHRDFPSNIGLKPGIPGSIIKKLARLNDGPSSDISKRKSFPQIADYIEKNL